MASAERPVAPLDPSVPRPILQRVGLDQNLRFLLHEVVKQVERTAIYLKAPREELATSIVTRDDHVDNLKRIIQGKCFALAGEPDVVRTPMIEYLRALTIIGANLERIADFCVDVVHQMGFARDPAVLVRRDYSPFFRQILQGLSKVDVAIFTLDLDRAVEICQCEHELDQLYRTALEEVLQALGLGEEPAQSLVTLTFVHRFLERMGDSLQNIGEAVLSAAMGEPVKIDQFELLETTLETIHIDTHEGLEMARIGETRSGCRIDRVRQRGSSSSRSLLFKEGLKAKVMAEVEGMERWRALRPSMVPTVFSVRSDADRAAILREYLAGETLEQLVRKGPTEIFSQAVTALEQTLSGIWRETRVAEPLVTGFLDQLRKRLSDVYALHPAFRNGPAVPVRERPTFDSLLESALRLDEILVAPASVLIHGDCNVDNFLYDAERQRLTLVDLHRSRRGDFLQDVSVFVVSNQRLLGLDEEARSRAEQAIDTMVRSGQRFARETGDHLANARLAVGLVRSWATSARFVLDDDEAHRLFDRAEDLLAHLGSLDDVGLREFEIPRELLRV